MSYKEKLLQLKHNKHYLERYFKFIDYCLQQELLKGYTENHHILPVCLFPEYTNLIDNPWNKCTVTGRQHYIAHWLLWKAIDDPKTMRSFLFSHSSNTKQDRYINPFIKRFILKKFAEYQKDSMIGEGNPYYGKKHSDEVRQKMSKSKKGRHNNSWNTGKTKDTDEKLKEVGNNISRAKQGIRWWTNGIEEAQAFSQPEDGWYIGRVPNKNFKFSEERKQKMRESFSDGKMSWWNDGENNKRQKDCPGEGWSKGRLLSKQHKLNMKKK